MQKNEKNAWSQVGFLGKEENKTNRIKHMVRGIHLVGI
jgi:hypothetical protein